VRKAGVNAWALISTPSGPPRQGCNRLSGAGQSRPGLPAGGGDALVMAAKQILGNAGKGPFVFNLGHGVLRKRRRKMSPCWRKRS